MTPQEIAEESRTFLRTYILGGPILVEGQEVTLIGIRRRRPFEGFVPPLEQARDELPEEAPMPELDGLVVELEDDGSVEGVVLDFIPLENAVVTLEPAEDPTISIIFVLCTNYPPEQLANLIDPADFTGKRIVTLPQDPRFHLWVVQCLDVLYHRLGGDLGNKAIEAQFVVDTLTDRFEELLAAGLILEE